MKEIKLPPYARLSLIMVGIVCLIFLLYVGQGLFIPLFFAIFISLLLYPVAKTLEVRFGMGRGVSSLIVLSAFILFVAAFLYFLVYEILLFSQDLPLLQQRLNVWFVDIQQWITEEYHVDGSEQVAYMNGAINNMLANMAASIGNIFNKVIGVIFWIIIIFIYTYFILHHRRLLMRFLLRLFGDDHQMKVKHVLLETRRATYSYMGGLLVEFVVMTLANCTAFAILGIKYAVLLGLIAALLNFIPYLGFIMAAILVFAVTMIHGSPLLALEAVGLLFILHVLDANILFARVIGHHVKMNALITIISVLAGGALWGVAGMFLSIPITAMLKIIFSHIEDLQPWAFLMGVEEGEKKSELKDMQK